MIQIENLRHLITNEKVSMYQRALAKLEFDKIEVLLYDLDNLCECRKTPKTYEIDLNQCRICNKKLKL